MIKILLAVFKASYCSELDRSPRRKLRVLKDCQHFSESRGQKTSEEEASASCFPLVEICTKCLSA